MKIRTTMITMTAVLGILALVPGAMASIIATGDMSPSPATWEAGSVTDAILGNTGVGTVTVSGYSGGNDLTIQKVTANTVFGNSSGGDGTLNIQGGAKVYHASGNTHVLGAAAGSKGTVNVTGTDGSGNRSIWDLGTTQVEMQIGDLGDAVVNVTAGGYFYTKKNMVANRAGSTATITVSGTGSQWENRFDQLYGRGGTATTYILDGGWLKNEGDVFGMGSNAGAVATVTVSGIDSGGTASRFTAQRLDVGQNGTGTLNIGNGGVVRTTQLRIDNNNNGGDFIYMSNGGVLALQGDHSAGLSAFLDAIYVGGTLGNYSNQIKYGSPGDWTDLTTSTDLTGIGTLTYYSSSTLVDGVQMNGYTALVIPEPGTIALLGLAGLAMFIRRRFVK